MGQRRTVLFDLDGTLSDPLLGIGNALRYATEAVGVAPPSEAALRQFVGPPLREGLGTVLGLDSSTVTAVLAAYRVYYADRGLYENTLYPGITDLLGDLHDAGVRCAVATSKPSVYAEQIVAHFGLTHLFDVIAGATLDSTRTSKADVIAHALHLLEADGAGTVEGGGAGTVEGGGARRVTDGASRTVMVGDRSHDVAGAAAHSLDCVGVLWGYGTAEELIAAGAVAVVDSTEQLAKQLAALLAAPLVEG